MQIKTIDEQEWRIYIINDDIDSSSIKEFESELLAFCDEAKKDVIIDLEGVLRIDSLVLAMFLRAKNLLSKKGRKFYLAHPSEAVRKTIEIASLNVLFLGEDWK